MPLTKTTFSKILGIVGVKKSHRIKTRASTLRAKRLDRLKSLGVRPLSRRAGMDREIPKEYESLYSEAYKALRASNRPWATESEVRAILRGDKQMSRQRSAEVIEILRKSRVPGFRETDEVTSGDIYSERILHVLGRREKLKAKAESRKMIRDLVKKDKTATGTLPSSEKSSQDKTLNPAKLVSLPASQTRMDTYGGRSKQKENILSAEELEAYAKDFADQEKAKSHKGSVLSKPKSRMKKTEEEEEEKEVPLAFDIDDMT